MKPEHKTIQTKTQDGTAESVSIQVRSGGLSDRIRRILIWGFQILLVLVLGIVVSIGFFQTVSMQESSMEPTLTTGENYFINKAGYKLGSPKRGELIVFKTTSDADASLYIKRVIGLPGETVQIENGQIRIDGSLYKEGQDFPTINYAGLAETPIVLGKDEYFVLGDNRNNSEDSRYPDIGNVKRENIVGKLWLYS
ncbi:MAG: signal peptidase I [Lachnospiraceae bacterium]